MGLEHGFELIQEDTVSEINSTAKLYRHKKSGAELLSVINKDENKVFGVTFRTPPQTSNGIAHIMEHCVLCGSEKYPVKEPFIEMVKGSLKTYLNAVTYPDRTSYPVASTNTKDLYNLIDVYLDAVFHPLLTEHNMEQEGWHYELESKDDPLVFKGVVFNEMKGAYSSPEGNLYRRQQQVLFDPSHTYGVDSGGDPEVIPELTYDEFMAFHQKYYHPSNARIYFYGDDNPEERLIYLDKILSDFDAIEVDSDIDTYPLRTEATRFTFPYAVDSDDPKQNKNFVSINWLLPEVTDSATQMGLGILSRVLSGSPGAPLRRALVESGLGEDTLGGGFAAYLRQPLFSAGMKGVSPENIQAVESLVLDTLTRLANEGIDPEEITSAINTTEFRLRESNTGGFPRGLAYMFSVVRDWIYGYNPIDGLRYEEALETVKQLNASGNYFESLIKTYVLENSHQVTVILEPDPSLSEELETSEIERLTEAKAGMTETELEAIIENTRILKQKQVEPNLPEELAKLPMLQISDLDKEIKSYPIDIEIDGQSGREVIHHDLFTNGIVYFRLGMTLKVIPQDLLPYVPLFGAALTEVGTKHSSYIELLQKIGQKTGGVGAGEMVNNQKDSPEAMGWFWVRGKSTVANMPDLLNIMREMLFDTEFNDQERFRQMVLEEKAQEESRLIPGGHQVVMSRLKAIYSEANWVAEEMGGLEYLNFLRKLAVEVDSNWEGVLNKLNTIRSLLVNRNTMVVDTTLDGENYRAIKPQIITFLNEMPFTDPVLYTWKIGGLPANEGLTIPAQVNYVAKGINLYDYGFEYSGSIQVALNIIRTGHLWDKVRMQGGAYGAFIQFNQRTGVASFGSYRDPNLSNTLNVYDETADYLRTLTLPQQEVDRAIIGVIGSMDSYKLPDAKGYTALMRHLHRTTDEERQQRRDEVLSTTLADIQRFAEALESIKSNGRVVVMGSSDAIQAANEGDWMTVNQVL